MTRPFLPKKKDKTSYPESLPIRNRMSKKKNTINKNNDRFLSKAFPRYLHEKSKYYKMIDLMNLLLGIHDVIASIFLNSETNS